MKSRRIAVSFALVGGMVAPVAPAGAQQQDTHCRGEYIVTLSPGIGSQPVSNATLHSGGESGRIDCGGYSGTIGIDGRYGTKDPVTCTSGGEGWGVFSYTFDGETVKDTLTFEFGGISGGVISGTYEGERYSGNFTSTPIDGNCASAPVTRAKVQLDGVLQGG